jgi:diaminopimelate epimerase
MITEMDSKEKTIGIMLLEKESGKMKINPIVWVKEIDTVFYETACGNGSLGTAIYNYLKNKDKKIELIQPSGYSINIELEGNNNYIENAIISGIVGEE